jgi:GNAT superfamily N-acetyltransferase
VSTIVVRPLTSSKDVSAFIKLPWSIYADDPMWVPPLLMDRKKLIDKRKNPFYAHSEAEFFLAERDGKVVGRIGAILNHNHNKEHGENIGFFGFFECINDQSVANALFDAAKKYLAQFKVTAVRGPANPSVNDEYGLLVEGFDSPPVVLMTYNPPYYDALISAYGFRKTKDLYAYIISQDDVYTERLERAVNIVRQRNRLTFRTMDMKHFKEEVDRIKVVYNAAWQKNWGAVPMTDAEFDALAADLKPVVEPGLIVIAEANGKPVGFGLSLPDINVPLKYNTSGHLLTGLYHLMTKKKKINLVRVIALGVVPEYANSGAAGVLFYETARRAKAMGYQYGEASWILEDNVMMNRAAETLQGKIYKRYRIYDLPVTA